MNRVDVNLSGPLFDGRADTAIDDFVKDAQRDLAAQTYSEVMGNLNGSIRHPTPYYETQVTVTPTRAEHVVHDRGIVYGPWLETGYHGSKPTRFRGYLSFARARAAMELRKHFIVQTVLLRHLRRMG